ncbi:response regulator [Sulfurospirillum barnesii]|uniref:Response regulator with CheY-like receiver domain and winged-helix DNA-binding domain n=1 Tax=Sulfurospirillum barnesii (strain ATCC 700032 / DSM 10660 / SES-3) TaxID=760154 RepID=I3XXT4_SULBS|nr:response regulator [Sulfurospirillum barnesii]AFL68758.1 response regulator with CheY-like receiver domain and winged-helix DNA-binding domain [Sulfurospirillum barnesii SES-3]
MLKVMIIEDEPLIALNLEKLLEKKGFEVTGHASNWEEAHTLFHTTKPHIVLSDIKLENDESGIDIVKQLKKMNDFCVIYLTSYGDDAMIEKALSTNPAAYITKPFKEIDLNAALKLVSSKIKNKNINPDFYYNKETRALFYKNAQIILTKQESDLFHICYLSKGFFVSMANVEYAIWGEEHVSDSTRRGLIHRLRKKLHDTIFEYSSGLGCKVDKIA